MGRKVYVGNLAWRTDEASLRTVFATFGVVEDAKIVVDRDSGQSRGFGFVTFADETSAAEAVRGMDGADLEGRVVRVREAEDRPGGRGDDRPARRGPPNTARRGHTPEPEIIRRRFNAARDTRTTD